MAFQKSTLGLQRKSSCFWLGECFPRALHLNNLFSFSLKHHPQRSHTLTGECRPPLEDKCPVPVLLWCQCLTATMHSSTAPSAGTDPSIANALVTRLVPGSCVGVCVPAPFRTKGWELWALFPRTLTASLWEVGLSTSLD